MKFVNMPTRYKKKNKYDLWFLYYFILLNKGGDICFIFNYLLISLYIFFCNWLGKYLRKKKKVQLSKKKKKRKINNYRRLARC